ncbi:hypothetical protein [Nonomuraea africana]|uniref:DNA-binding IclR family transcriptional regulator n=1 Tax=Nonomuraea africana TaxID=46171 RepID=A0ABR9KID5_9ACTN|nr:hypothetical protein [Nonomuraea africana]MBE1561786.1 DNA-binding IclR family transcriptional regulator [Nonomuraea africana]
MRGHRDVQALSDTDLAVYEAVAAIAVGGEAASLAAVARSTGLTEERTRASMAILVEKGQVVPSGDGFRLGRHDFEVDY